MRGLFWLVEFAQKIKERKSEDHFLETSWVHCMNSFGDSASHAHIGCGKVVNVQ